MIFDKNKFQSKLAADARKTRAAEVIADRPMIALSSDPRAPHPLVVQPGAKVFAGPGPQQPTT